MKENKYVRDKKDNLIYLNEDGKLQEVSYIDKKSGVRSATSSFSFVSLKWILLILGKITYYCLPF